MSELELKPSILVIFGITGDLAKRKVLPALYNLYKDQLLPQGTKIVGVSRRDLKSEEVIDTVSLCVHEQNNTCDPVVLHDLFSSLSTIKLDPLVDDDYDKLSDYLNQLEEENGICLDRLFYLSIPPQVYGPIIKKLGEHKLNGRCKHNSAESRLLVEKPFGYDYDSAERLITETNEVFSEEQIFRIDHYLAKETAQNILKFRRHNPIFSHQWDHQHIKEIQVIAKESIGIENRVVFYESIGAMRDLVQSHLLQLLSLTAMKIPAELTNDEIHAEKHRFLESLIPLRADEINDCVVRGQYDSYRQEVANPSSQTETFVSIYLRSQDPNWQGTLFNLTTGKALDNKETVIKLIFGGGNEQNILSLRIQPDEGIAIELVIEEPGFRHQLEKVKLNYNYSENYNNDKHDAYERVLVDAIRGDKLLFATKSEVMASWRLLQPILEAWKRHDSQELRIYPFGSAGPDIKA